MGLVLVAVLSHFKQGVIAYFCYAFARGDTNTFMTRYLENNACLAKCSL